MSDGKGAVSERARPPGDVRGRRILQVAVWSTAAFAVASLLGVVWPGTFAAVVVVVDLGLFVAGCGAFAWAYARAVARSRYEVPTLAGLFFLADGVAPAPVVRVLRAAFAGQVVVAVGAAAARPFTESAFGVLVPVLGLGLMALWGARHGAFARRAPD